MVVYALTEEQLWEVQDVARASERSGEAWPLSFCFDNVEIENNFEEFRDKSGWKGLDAESAVECFIRYVKDRR